jgi:hypothetical protein
VNTTSCKPECCKGRKAKDIDSQACPDLLCCCVVCQRQVGGQGLPCAAAGSSGGCTTVQGRSRTLPMPLWPSCEIKAFRKHSRSHCSSRGTRCHYKGLPGACTHSTQEVVKHAT